MENETEANQDASAPWYGNFWSTRDSINNDILSVSAIIETFLAVAIYWWIAVHFETYLPLLVSATVAPFVLLRSDESVALGLKWFAAWERRIWSDHQLYGELEPKERTRVKALVVVTTLLAGITAYLLSQQFLGGSAGWGAFGCGFGIAWAAATVAAAVGVLVAGVVTGPVPGAEPGALAVAGPGVLVAALATGISASVSENAAVVTVVAMFTVAAQQSLTIAIPIMPTGRAIRILLLFSPLIVPGVTLGVFTVSLIIRVGATLRHFQLGVRNLPRNFRRLVLCTSPRQTPELIPDLRAGGTAIALENLWQRFQTDRRSNDVVKRIVAYVFYPLTIPFWFIPGWLYRVTLKSTAWFWWPLAFLGGDLQHAKDPDEFRRKKLESLWAKTSIVLSIGTISIFLYYNCISTGALFKDNPLLTVLGYFLFINWALLPWQILTIAVAFFSLAIAFGIDDAAGEYRNAKISGDHARIRRATRKLGWIERLARLRLVLMITLWLLVGGQALLYFNSRNCWFSVPTNIESWANWAYGNKLPQRHCID